MKNILGWLFSFAVLALFVIPIFKVMTGSWFWGILLGLLYPVGIYYLVPWREF